MTAITEAKREFDLAMTAFQEVNAASEANFRAWVTARKAAEDRLDSARAALREAMDSRPMTDDEIDATW